MGDITIAGVLFWGLALLTLGSALGVALARNILYSGFALLGALVGVAGLYLFVGADFLGVVQLLVYVGGILVLILFAVLLTNRIGELRLSNASVNKAAAGIGAAALLGLLIQVGYDTAWPQIEASAAPTVARIGDALLREYLLPFELASIVLLMALVGAMVIARRAAKTPPRGEGDTESQALRRLD